MVFMLIVEYCVHLSVTDAMFYAMLFEAPEVASAQPYGHATDWWSLGILMYALLCGRVCRFFLLVLFTLRL